MVSTEIRCLPDNLPESIAIDISSMDIGDTLHLSDISLPDGVTIVALTHSDASYNQSICYIAKSRLTRVSGGGEEEESDIDDSDDAESTE